MVSRSVGCCVAFAVAAVLSVGVSTVVAQDTRAVSEPVFPATCKTLTAPYPSLAPLDSEHGRTLAAEVDTDENALLGEKTLMEAFRGCAAGQAVELVPGASTDAFLLKSVHIPKGMSLIVDGGVTIFASTNPSLYDASPGYCGTMHKGDDGCIALLNFETDGKKSGLYGFGIVDGRGWAEVTGPREVGMTWWQRTLGVRKQGPGIYQNNIKLVSAVGDNFELYKITLRNSPFWNVLWNQGTPAGGFTAWGVKIMAPWNIGNTDGIDVDGDNATIRDSVFAVGDDEVAVEARKHAAKNITITGVTGYGRNGISMGGEIEAGISNVLVQNVNLTAQIAKVSGHTVNGLSESVLKSKYGLMDYTQALPYPGNSIRGLNVKTRPKEGSVTNITFSDICMLDIDQPMTIEPYMGKNVGTGFPTIENITYRNIHVLPPVQMPAGKPFYRILFQGYDSVHGNKNVTMDNVVFDDAAEGHSSLSKVTAQHNVFAMSTNVYPELLDNLKDGESGGGVTLMAADNVYTTHAEKHSKALAKACAGNIFPFTVGDLYAAVGDAPYSGTNNNLRTLHRPVGGTLMLRAMVQPAMSDVTLMALGDYNQKPGMLGVASPTLTEPVEFYDGAKLIGRAAIKGVGALATYPVKGIAAGTHVYRVRYPGDANYPAHLYASTVTVTVP